MTSKQKNIIVCSTEDIINKAKVYGKLNLYDIALYQVLTEQLEYVKNITNREGIFKNLQNIITKIQFCSDNITNDISSILPDTSYYIDENGNLITDDSTPPTIPYVNASNFTVTNIIEEPLFSLGPDYDTYNFTLSDFLNAYSDNNDGNFYSIKIDRTNLDGLRLKRQDSPTTGNVYGENPSFITINKADIYKWSFYASSSALNYIHEVQYKFVDNINGQLVESNIATITVDRTAFSGNQPATIGDNTVPANNREVKTLTLAMFTSGLTPPYNDPEGDLIDAIRIDEISTANKGIFYLNGIEIVVGQIITREDINAELFTYESPDQNDIWSDAFNFSARDEGSKQWVN